MCAGFTIMVFLRQPRQQVAPFLPTLAEIESDYQGYIIDLWGVLHDGGTAYPGAHDALARLQDLRKQVLLLSNAPRRAFKAEQVLEGLGFTKGLYQHVLTSGEAVWQHMQRAADSSADPLPYVYIGPEKDADLLEGMAYRVVEDAKAATCAVATGFDDFGQGLESKQAQLDACLEAGLPLVCANPDREVVKRDGRRMACAGLMGEYYVDRGGQVQWFGKPYAAVYSQALGLLDVPKAKILAIGDSLHTDIAGAAGFGIDSALVTGGILADALQVDHQGAPDEKALQRLCEEEGAVPSYILPGLV